jgi:protein gp37
MSEKTNIAWTDSTINFWSGCTKVSDGCKNCYAETRDKRHMIEKVDHWGKGVPRLKSVGAVKQALAMNRKPWICDECGEASNIQFENTEIEKHFCSVCKKPVTMHRRRIFSLSLGDWLDDEVPVEWIAEMLDTIRQCPDVTWILCTKRPENFSDRIIQVVKHSWTKFLDSRKGGANAFGKCEINLWLEKWFDGSAIPSNIILLTSVENQATADKRIPELLKIPAACRGLSLEPLLAPVDVSDFTVRNMPKPAWLICGGESGANARSCNVDWIRSLVAQGKLAGIATFVKQLGAKPVCDCSVAVESFSANCCKHFPFPIRDKKGGDIEEWSNDLRVREWPKGF